MIIKIWVKVLFTYTFYLPGLILHEGSHAIAAIITGSKITKIKLFPQVKFEKNGSYNIIYGYVASIASYRAANMLIGIAPLFLWLIPISVAYYLSWIHLDPFFVRWESLFSLKNWWFILLLFQIAWAGTPSSQDWKVFFFGLFSLSGVVLLATSLIVVFAGPDFFKALLTILDKVA